MGNAKRLLGVLVVLMLVGSAFADFAGLVNYQGKLTDNDGVPIETAVDVTFTIYDAATGGTAIWTQGPISVTPVHGLFNAELDVSAIAWDSYPSLWLEITVDDGTPYVLSPRERLTSAFHALNIADDVVSDAKLKMTAHGTASEDNYLLSYDNATGGFTWVNPDVVGGVNSVDANSPLSVDHTTGDVTISIQQADGTNDGYLSSTDWNAFDGKLEAGDNVSDLTNDAGYIDTETDPVVGAVTGIVKADGAGAISAAVAGTDYDPSSTNELQDLSITGDVLTITGITTPTEIDLSPYLDNTDDQTDAEVDLTDWTPDLNYVTESGNVHSAIGELDAQVKTNADAIAGISVNQIHDVDNTTRVIANDDESIEFYTNSTLRGNIVSSGNVWFDQNMYLGGGLHIQESGSDVMNVDGTSGNVWTAGDLYFNNQKSIWANSAVGPAQKVITFRDGSDNMIIYTSPAPGNNLYIKDDEGDNIIQFSGGDNELTFAFGSIVDGEAGTNNIGSGTHPFNAVYVDNMVRWNDDDATTISAASLGGASSALYIGNRKILVYGEQGSNWWDGSGAPGSGTGADGDYYLNNDNSDYYYKSSGSWTLKGNLRGTGWFSGDGNPVDTIPGLYKAGDLWFNTEAGTEAEGEYWTYDGTSWSATAVGDLTGPRGSRGEAGASILTGLGAPAWDLGLEGDYYIDTTSTPTEHHRYLWGPKPSDTNWPTSYSVDLVGPAGGRTIHNGTVAPSSGDGIDGDFWINTTTNYIWGPKASGAWTDSVSLVGPIGPEGPTGPRGYGLAYRWVGTKLWVKVDSSGADSSYSDLQGPAGPAGPQGPAGTGLTNRGAWVSGTTDYVESDYVFDESSGTPGVNSMWICQSDVDSPPYDTQPKDDPTHWVEFEAPPGEDGQDAYVYIAYADADDGTGFTNTFDPTKDYIAILSSDSLISSPIATDFDGLWKKYRGAQGIQGIQGDNAYVYIAYAGNASGAGFTMTFDSTLNYIAILDTNEEITPVVSDFDGLWKNYKGPEGIQGDPGVGLNYLWDGTKLGVKREDEDSVEYDYVDLLGPVAGSANQVVYKNASNVATGSDNLQFDGNDLYVGGDIYVHNNSIHLSDGTNAVTLSAPTITADRAIAFPDNSGTVALTTDIPGSQDLQSAYDEGADIVVAAGTPVTMTSSGSGNVALEVTAGAARGIQAINDATNNAAIYARNDGTGPAIYSSGDLRMSGTSGTKIYSTADINVQLDEGGGAGMTNNFNILDDAETVVFTVDEGGNVTAGTWQGSAIGESYIDGAITRDEEWDDIAEIEAATGVDIITSTENNDAADDLSDNDLTDIGDVAGPPADGKILKYNGTAGEWQMADDAGGANQLTDLSDVNTATATNGNLLMADGTDWESVAQTSITQLGTISAGTWQGSAIGESYIDGAITRDEEWNTIAEIEAATGVDIITSTENNDAADDLSDNDLTDIGDVAGPPADGKILKYNGTAGEWQMADDAGGANQLTDLSDVNTATATNGNLLMADGTDWESVAQTSITQLGTITSGTWQGSAIGESYIDGAITRDTEWDDIAEIEAATGVDIITSTENNDAADDLSDNTTDDLAEGTINLYEDLSDNNLTDIGDVTGTPADGKILKYNGTAGEWQMADDAGGANQLTDLSDVNTATATNGNLLMADGTDWESVAQTSITQLGTITSGTWQGSAIGEGYIDGAITRDSEWDTEAEVATAWGVTHIWTNSNDGSGSGLDADLIDGHNYSSNWGVLGNSIETGEITDGTIVSADIANATEFVDVQDFAGTSQFSVTDGDRSLQFQGVSGASVAFDAANKRVVISGSGGGSVGSGNQGALAYYPSTGTSVQGTDVGTSGQILQSNGGASAPSWIDQSAINAGQVPWTGITGMPACFSDGVDNTDDNDDIAVELNNATVDGSVYTLDFQSPITVVSDGASEVNIDINESAINAGQVDGHDYNSNWPTTSTTVNAAGAVMNSDFTANGVMIRTGSGTYTTQSPLAVGYGGTGRSSLNDNQILLGNATSAIDYISAPTTGDTYLKWNGTGYEWASAYASNQDLTDGNGLSGGVYDGSTARTWAVNAGNGLGFSGDNVIVNTGNAYGTAIESDNVAVDVTAARFNGPGITNGGSPAKLGVDVGTGLEYSDGTDNAKVQLTSAYQTGSAYDSRFVNEGQTAGGDLNGTYPSPTVDGLQGRSVASTAPSSGQVLKWNGSAWAPAADGTGGDINGVNVTAPITGGGSSGTVTIGIQMDKDITVSGTGMSGGANNVLPGADGDVNIALTTNKDIVAGNGLGGGADNVLPGADSDVTLTVNAGTGIYLSGDAVCATDNSASNELQNVVAGNGLTGGGSGTTTTLSVGAGTGISVAANTVGINTTWLDARIESVGDANYVPYTGATGNVNLGSWDLTVDVVHANKVDPTVQIDGQLYVTWMAENIGFWIDIISEGKLDKGVFTVDLAQQPVGSDLWLFWRTVAEGTVIPLVTAQDPAILMANVEGSVLTVRSISGQEDARFSFRLSGKRLDEAKKSSEEINIPKEDTDHFIDLDRFDRFGNPK